MLVANIRDMTPALAKQSYDLLLADKGGITRDAALDLDGIRTVLALRSKYGSPQKTLDRSGEIRRSHLLRKGARQALSGDGSKPRWREGSEPSRRSSGPTTSIRITAGTGRCSRRATRRSISRSASNFRRLHDYRLARTRAALAQFGAGRAAVLRPAQHPLHHEHRHRRVGARQADALFAAHRQRRPVHLGFRLRGEASPAARAVARTTTTAARGCSACAAPSARTSSSFAPPRARSRRSSTTRALPTCRSASTSSSRRCSSSCRSSASKCATASRRCCRRAK